jgi:16S rRNA (cytidine1402-2'-O)-methyltransferase
LNKTGILYIVATPIGNIEDITLRALRILKEVDIIAAEDTRHTLKLLNYYEIKKRLVSYHEHNRIKQGKYLIEQLLEGNDIALVSDAGTPGISDPGEDIIKLAIEANINITVVPGATAAITGLILSGLPTDRFAFEGFLPMNRKSRKKRVAQLKKEQRTLVLYEAPHKLISTLDELYKNLGNRRIVLARELTKKFEEVIRCTLEEAINFYRENTPRGEYVLVLQGCSKKEDNKEKDNEWAETTLDDHFNYWLEKGLERNDALRKVAEERGMSRREVYNGILKIKQNDR